MKHDFRADLGVNKTHWCERRTLPQEAKTHELLAWFSVQNCVLQLCPCRLFDKNNCGKHRHGYKSKSDAAGSSHTKLSVPILSYT